jgi:hypothetical protein
MVCLARFKPTLFGHIDVPTIKNSSTARQLGRNFDSRFDLFCLKRQTRKPINYPDTRVAVTLDAPIQVATITSSQQPIS